MLPGVVGGAPVADSVGGEKHVHPSSTEITPAKPKRILRRPALLAGYGGEDEMPLGGYAVLLGAYVLLFGSGLALARRKLPRRYSAGDFGLLALATHKISRILVKDWVTSPLRAPFVRYEGSAGGGEVKESARGRGLRRAIGDLLTCPWCSAPWVGGALLLGFATRPRVTRAVATLFAAVTASDFLNHAYASAREAST
jgi:hypothetical protein